MKNRIVSGIGAILSGLLISLGPQFIFKACEPTAEGKWMACHWTVQAELGIGLLIAVLGVLLLVFQSQKIRFGLSVAIVLAGVLAVLFPTVLIGGCAMKTMTCRSVTFPALEAIGVLTIAGFAVNSIYLLRAEGNRKEGNG